MFSSAVGVIGNPGQANYGAANNSWTRWQHRRRAQGPPAVWRRGVVGEVSGMTPHMTATDVERMGQRGLCRDADGPGTVYSTRR